MAKLKDTHVYGNINIDNLLNVTNDATFSGNATVTGNLTVMGTTTTVNSTTVQVEGPIVQQGSGPNGTALTNSDGKDRGLQLSYYDSGAVDAFLGYLPGSSTFTLAKDATISTDVVVVNKYGNLNLGTYALANVGHANAAGVITADGGGLGNLTGANVTGTVANANYASYAGIVTGNAQSNITSLGTLSGLTIDGGDLSVQNANIITSGSITANGDLTIGIASGAGANSANANIYGNLNVTGTITGTINATIEAKGNSWDIQYKDNTGNTAGSDAFKFDVGNRNTVTVGSKFTFVGDTGVANIGGDINLTNANTSINGTNVTANAGTTLVLKGGTSNITANASGLFIATSTGNANFDANANLTVSGTANFSGGNFTVNANGNVVAKGTANIANGNLTVDANGNLVAKGTANIANGNLTVDANGNVNAAGYGSFAEVYITDAGGGGYNGELLFINDSTGLVNGASDLTYLSSVLSAPNIDISTDANIQGNVTLSNSLHTAGNLLTTNTNGNIIDSNVSFSTDTLTLTNANVTANLKTANLQVTSFANTGIPIADVNGNLSTSTNLTFSSNTLFTTAANVSGQVTASHVAVNTLSNTQVVFSDASGNLIGSASLTFNTDSNTLTAGNITSTHAFKAANIYDTDLNLNSIVFADMGGLLTQNANFTFDPSTGVELFTTGNANVKHNFEAANVQVSGLNVSGGMVYTDVNGNLKNASNVAYNAVSDTLTLTGNITSNYANITANIKTGGLLTDNLYYSNGTAWDFAKANGNTYDIQFKSTSGDLQGSDNFRFDATSNTLTVTGNANVTTVNATTGNITTVNSTYLNATGNANVTGNVSANNVSVTTDLSVTGNANVTTNLNVIGTANVTGNVSLSNNLAVTGNANVTTDLNVTGNANVTGNVSFANNLSVTGSANVTANLNVTGHANINGYLNAGDTVITGNLTVTGVTTSINTTTSQLTDPLIDLGTGANGASLTVNDAYDRGLVMHTRVAGTNDDLFMGWSAANSAFVLAKHVTVSNNVVTYDTANLADVYLGNITANNANFGGAVFSNGNITLGSGSYLNGNINGNISGNITVTGGAGAIQFSDSSNTLSSSANLNFDNSNVTLTVGNGSTTGKVIANLLTGTLTTGAQPNITSASNLTSVGTLSNLTVGNSTANTSMGNGTITASGTIQAANIVDTALSTNQIAYTTSGNVITGDTNFTYDGSNLLVGSTISANVTTGAIVAANLTSNNLTIANALVFTDSTGLLKNNSNIKFDASASNLTVNGNIITGTGSGGNITGANVVSASSFTASSTVDFTATSNVALGDVGNVHIGGGSSGYVLQTDGNGGLSWTAAPNVDQIENGSSNVHIDNNANVTITVDGTEHWVFDTTGNLTGPAAGSANLGNLVTANYVAGTLTTNVQTNITSVGTLTSLTVANTGGTGNITSDNANLGNVATANLFTGTLTTGAQPNITSASNLTSIGTLTSLTVANTGGTGNITSNNANLGNLVTSGYSKVTNLGGTGIVYANASNILTTDATNFNYTSGSGTLSVPNANVSSNLTVVGNIAYAKLNTNQVPYTASGNVLTGSTAFTYDGSLLTVDNANITTLLTTVSANVTGNITSGNANITTLLTSANANVTGLLTVGNINVTNSANLGAIGNVTITGGTDGQYLVANGSTGGLKWATVDAAMISNGTSNVNIATANGDVTVAVNGNAIIDVTGTGANVTGYVTVHGDIQGNNITATANIIAEGTTDATSAITGTITTAGGISAQGNIYTGHAVGFAGNGPGNTSSAAYIQFNSSANSLDFIFN